MRILLPLILCPLLAIAADDLRTFTEKNMAELAGRITKSLRKCDQLRKGSEVQIDFMNATSEFIDKDAFSKAIQAQIPPSPEGPGRKYDLVLKLSSVVQQKGADYKGTYTLDADLKQADEALCHKSEKLVKKGKIPK